MSLPEMNEDERAEWDRLSEAVRLDESNSDVFTVDVLRLGQCIERRKLKAQNAGLVAMLEEMLNTSRSAYNRHGAKRQRWFALVQEARALLARHEKEKP